ncbi:MAG: tRNA epoxyqueuosine(34) reductase QueG [Bacteroidaceae bacterium]|nr:tRNA epoxyqueuosine(34) reductase QueG [Bacteroidaceae bacterium]
MENSQSHTIDFSVIKAEAMRLGFSACGVAAADVVDAETRRIYEQCMAEGRMADMNYLARYPDLRFDPTQLLPGCRTIICVALSYYPRQPLPDDTYQIAYYAYGRDYHEVMRQKLAQLISPLAAAAGITDVPSHFRPCTDTAPMLERYWAVRSGIGFIGRNHTLIIPRLGSFFFLGEVLTTIKPTAASDALPFVEGRRVRESSCASCHRCIDACPTGALHSDGTFDARRCLSYLTIEHRGPFTPEQADMVSSQPTPYYIYGCDRCQRCCPHNQRAVPTTEPLLQPNQQLYSMTPTRWKQLTREQYQQLFAHSAVKRAKYEGLMRNIECVY